MDGRDLTNKYDQIILAGASLGAINDQFPAWGSAFIDHVQVALDLHHISKVIVMDHRDCGAYKVILGQDFSKNIEAETVIHTQQLQKVAAEITARGSRASRLSCC
jgi:carbonic anhydrase